VLKNRTIDPSYPKYNGAFHFHDTVAPCLEGVDKCYYCLPSVLTQLQLLCGVPGLIQPRSQRTGATDVAITAAHSNYAWSNSARLQSVTGRGGFRGAQPCVVVSQLCMESIALCAASFPLFLPAAWLEA